MDQKLRQDTWWFLCIVCPIICPEAFVSAAWISDRWIMLHWIWATAWQFICTKKIFYCIFCLAALWWLKEMPILLPSTWLCLLPLARWQWILWEAASRCPRCRCAWCRGPGSAGTSASPPASENSHLLWTAAAGLEMLCREWEEDSSQRIINILVTAKSVFHR